MPLTRALNTLANNARRRARRDEIPWKVDIFYAFHKSFRVGSAIVVIISLVETLASIFPIRSDFSTNFRVVSKTAWIAYFLAHLKKWALGIGDRDQSKTFGLRLV